MLAEAWPNPKPEFRDPKSRILTQPVQTDCRIEADRENAFLADAGWLAMPPRDWE
jgi:hypothetical protein